jgi:hypothetical protein
MDIFTLCLKLSYVRVTIDGVRIGDTIYTTYTHK